MVADIVAALGADETTVQTSAGKAGERCQLAVEGEPPHSVSLIEGLGPS